MHGPLPFRYQILALAHQPRQCSIASRGFKRFGCGGFFQSGNCQRPLPPVRLGYIRPARRLRPISPAVDAAVQISEPALKISLIPLPRHPVHARGGLTLEGVEGYLQGLDADVVEECGELLLLPLPCGFPYAVERLGHTLPASYRRRALSARRPVCALLFRVPLGPRPWLHPLRNWSPSLVRRLPRYYGGV